jgi:O-antigen/teichoic acid export membrane protein
MQPRSREANVALTGSGVAWLPAQGSLWHRWSRLKARLGNAEHLLVQRLAGTVFLIRLISAALAYASQVLFARWMGTHEFGIYVYVWTWVLLIGQSLDLGLATAAQRFIPEYRERRLFDLLRGYVAGARWLAVGIAIVVALACAGVVRLLQPWLNDYTVIPLYLGCLTLPACALSNVQDGISRSHDWVTLGILPTYIARQLLLTVLMAAAYFSGFRLDAVTALVLAGLSMWLPVFGQMLVLNRRLRNTIAAGPRAYDTRLWLRTALPILIAESFFLVLTNTDVLMLQQFRPAEDVAVYYAAAKTLALVSFIHFSIAATTAHRFSGYYSAGDRESLAMFLRQAIRWTFWPSLAATALLLVLGRPLLRLFGPQFASGYSIMFVLAIGLLARAAIGPMERFLIMLDQQRAVARAYALAIIINTSLCVILIPYLGAMGAAIATAAALVAETVSLFIIAKHRLGFQVFIWSRAHKR